MSDYKDTLNLPKTSFSMRANLAQREPETIAFWNKIQAATAMRSASGSKGFYILHDGPPYANGHIHMGTAMNKILKDIIVKSKNMQGQACEYVPGWDCHGLPIEHKVEQDLKAKRKDLPALVVRRLCREYASKWIDIQRQEFIRLGVLGNWEDPYLSMKPAYEAAIASNLADFVAKGSVIRARKPIYWCASCHTALAEAEVEYRDTKSPSIYVAFPLRDEAVKKVFPNANPQNCKVVIWTTTPWTLPDNEAITVHPDFEYALVESDQGQFIIARDRIESCLPLFGWTNARINGSAPGRELEGLVASHPFIERKSPLTLGTHVTLDSGTGCVHTAPGHGREDYEVGLKYGLDIYAPLNDAGQFLDSVEKVGGKTVWEANPIVIDELQKIGALLEQDSINHSYPHCWRCKQPVIFRATTQWFISMEANDLRKRALETIKNDVRWIPAWGEERIYNMIETRPDWCISRQRQWGVPIIALKCAECGEIWNDAAWMREICARFATHPTGCDFWYEAGIEEIAPAGLKCPSCGGRRWTKEMDILDVWFDSGSSFAAVLEARPSLHFPADLYLEGSDQHRGWFHSSLLISEGIRGRAPYKAVLTHGYVVDGEGRKMSKSLGNVIAPQQLIDKYGAEIIRLWASSVDYREDIRISDQILDRLVDAYRRIRNTCRFILGNLHDLEAADLLEYQELLPLDKFALHNAALNHQKIRKAYNDFEFHKIFHALHNYCVSDLSAFYFDILKDRLYTSAPKSSERRSAQTALREILKLLLLDMAPILSFTSEEIFQKVPRELRGPEETVFTLQDTDRDDFLLDPKEAAKWEFLLKARATVNKAMEEKRTTGLIGQNLDARLTLFLTDELKTLLEATGTDLTAAFIVSSLLIKAFEEAPEACFRDADIPGMAALVEKAPGEKCARCWTWSTGIGSDKRWPDVCPRCASVLAEISR